jgi:hypothetical protein
VVAPYAASLKDRRNVLAKERVVSNGGTDRDAGSMRNEYDGRGAPETSVHRNVGGFGCGGTPGEALPDAWVSPPRLA